MKRWSDSIEKMHTGPLFLNSERLATLMIKDLQSRPHKESKTLREAGVLEYQISQEIENIVTGKKTENGVAQSVGMNSEHYERLD